MDMQQLLKRSPDELEPRVDLDGVHVQVYGEVRGWTRAMRIGFGLVGGAAFFGVCGLVALQSGGMMADVITEIILPVGVFPFLMGSIWLRNQLSGTTLTLGTSELRMRGRRISLRGIRVKTEGAGQVRRLVIEGDGECWYIEADEPERVLGWIHQVMAVLQSEGPLPREQSGQVPEALEQLRGKREPEG